MPHRLKNGLTPREEADHIATEAIRRAAMSLCRERTSDEFTDGNLSAAQRRQIVNYLRRRYDRMCDQHDLDHAGPPIEVID